MIYLIPTIVNNDIASFHRIALALPVMIVLRFVRRVWEEGEESTAQYLPFCSNNLECGCDSRLILARVSTVQYANITHVCTSSHTLLKQFDSTYKILIRIFALDSSPDRINGYRYNLAQYVICY